MTTGTTTHADPIKIFPHQAGQSIGALVHSTLSRHSDRTAFAWDGGSISYGDLLARMAQYQQALRDAGITAGQGVAGLGGNRFEAWAIGTAVQAMGGYVTWLHPLGSLDDQLYQIDDSQVSAVVLDERHYAARSAELAQACAGRDLQVFTMGASDIGTDLAADLDALILDDTGTGELDVSGGVGDLSTINYTGGTTGRPKGAHRRQRSWVQSALSILADFDIPDRARYLLVAPMSHVAGTKVLPTLLRGGTVHLMNGFDPATVLETIERERISLGLFVPTMIYALLDHPDLDQRDLSSLEMVLYGASPMAASRLTEALDRIGPVFSQLYGQTELYPISVLARRDHDPDRPHLLASAGRPVTGVDVSIRDDDGNALPVGTNGEIWVRGATAMDGYWRLDELTAETTAHGWVHTGDIGTIDADGYLYIVDRKKDMVISGGFNVFPREVEDALAAHPDVAAAAVYGLPDDKWGERVVASVVLRDGATADAEQLAEHVRRLKGAVQTPKQYFFVDELPLTAVGKIDKKELRRAIATEGT